MARPRVLLLRWKSDDEGTLGALAIAGDVFCLTNELPWRDNAPQVSCIPLGTYVVRWSESPRLRKFTYEILGVPDRSGIRIHEGNFAGDKARGFDSHSLGCPLAGDRIGALRNSAGALQRAVLRSLPTLAALESRLNRSAFDLEVRNADS